jgi:hypothetical protein
MIGDISKIFKVERSIECPCCGKTLYVCREFSAEEQDDQCIRVVNPDRKQPLYIFADDVRMDA